MTEVTVYDGEEYWSRVAYDLIFFVWMGVLLFNVITQCSYLIPLLNFRI